MAGMMTRKAATVFFLYVTVCCTLHVGAMGHARPQCAISRHTLWKPVISGAAVEPQPSPKGVCECKFASLSRYEVTAAELVVR